VYCVHRTALLAYCSCCGSVTVHIVWQSSPVLCPLQTVEVRRWLSTEAVLAGSQLVAHVKWNWCLSGCHILVSYCCDVSLLLGEEAVALLSIGNTLWHVWTMFTRPAITPPEVNGFGWNLAHFEYIVWSWPLQILGAHTEARAGERAEILFFCQVNNAGLYRFPVSRISRYSHTICGSEIWWILSENIFENLPVRGLFSKKVNFCVKIFNDFGLQAAISTKWFTNRGKSRWVDWLSRI